MLPRSRRVLRDNDRADRNTEKTVWSLRLAACPDNSDKSGDLSYKLRVGQVSRLVRSVERLPICNRLLFAAFFAALAAGGVGFFLPSAASGLLAAARVCIDGCIGPAFRFGRRNSAPLITVGDVFGFALLLGCVTRFAALGH